MVSRVLAASAIVCASACLSTPPPPGSAADGTGGTVDSGTTPDARTSTSDAPDEGKPDAREEPDAAPPAGCDGLGFDPSNITCADIPEPAGKVRIEQPLAINTDNADCPGGFSCAVVSQEGGGPPVLVASASELVVPESGRIFVSGTRPLIVVAFGSIQIAGAIVVEPRAEANAGFCESGRGDGGTLFAYEIGPGGGGGGFGQAGGFGGDGNPGEEPAGGLANGDEALSPLRGGCAGGTGGSSGAETDHGEGGVGGRGGGALQLSAQTIDIAGGLFAPGGGGQGPQEGLDLDDSCDDAGGGGGGSGGAILLEGERVSLGSGSLVAVNGGGGASGCNGGSVEESRNGHPGAPLGDSAGGHNTDSNDGGAGATANRSPQDGGSDPSLAGGGGGGGSLGRVRINTAEDGPLGNGQISGVLSRGPLPR